MNNDFFHPSNLRKSLEDLGLTQRDLARGCKVNARTVSRWLDLDRSEKIRMSNKRAIEKFFNDRLSDKSPGALDCVRAMQDQIETLRNNQKETEKRELQVRSETLKTMEDQKRRLHEMEEKNRSLQVEYEQLCGLLKATVAQLDDTKGENQDLRIEKRRVEKKLHYLGVRYNKLTSCVAMRLKSIFASPLKSSSEILEECDDRFSKPKEIDIENATVIAAHRTALIASQPERLEDN